LHAQWVHGPTKLRKGLWEGSTDERTNHAVVKIDAIDYLVFSTGAAAGGKFLIKIT
jgi:hypothetical protein